MRAWNETRNPKSMNDSPAARQADASDHDWFSGEVQALLPSLYGVALRLCGDPADAEDLVADAITRAWEALPSLADRSAFRAWIFRILNNHYISMCRSARGKAVHEPLDTVAPAGISIFDRLHQPFLLWSSDPETEFLNRLLRADLERAIAALPDVFRAVVVLVDVQGLRYQEVAAILDIPLGTVRSRLARGRGLLQEALWEHASDAGVHNEKASDERVPGEPAQEVAESSPGRGDS